MAQGRDAALDLRWGRQGGRRTNAQQGHGVEELRKAREAHQRAHSSAPCDAGEDFERCPWCHPGLLDKLDIRTCSSCTGAGRLL